MDLDIYHGWRTYTHSGKITKQNQPEIISKITHTFSFDGWTTESNERTFIYNDSIDASIELIFKDETTEKERDMGLTKYGIILKCDFFDHWRKRIEHQEVCSQLVDKLPWCSHSFILINDEWILVKKTKRLRPRRKNKKGF